MKYRVKSDAEWMAEKLRALYPEEFMPTVVTIKLNKHPENDGRWGVLTGSVSPRVGRVSVLVFSHDERWYHQKPALPKADGTFSTDVAFGLEKPLGPNEREYVVIAYVGPDLPKESVWEDLNELPEGGQWSAPISVKRIDGLAPSVVR